MVTGRSRPTADIQNLVFVRVKLMLPRPQLLSPYYFFLNLYKNAGNSFSATGPTNAKAICYY